MTFGLLEWLLIGAGLMVGSRLLKKHDDETPDIAQHMLNGPIRHKLQVGDQIFMANASPFGFELDGVNR